MNDFRRFLLPLTVALALLAAPAAQASGARELPAGFNTAEMMPLSEIRPGMTGYLKTVFRGAELERCDVEILGIFPGFMAGRDIIVARLHLPWKDMGVIAGMSGSPVFINDRMIGAVAYGWTFSKEPIAGITPIEYMIEVYDGTESPSAGDDDSHRSASTAWGGNALGVNQAAASWSGRRPWYQQLAPSLERPDWQTSLENLGLGSHDGRVQTAALQPLLTPLSVSSANPATLKILERAFGDYGLFPVSAGGAGGTGNADAGVGSAALDAPTAAHIEHGSAVGVALMTGDLTLAGIGTVTYRKGDKLVAFGHPMMMDGESDLPMVSASILSVIPSFYRPFKLGVAGPVIGTLRQDRLPAIGGVFGPGPAMIPMRLSVRVDDRPAEEFHYELARHREFTPFLAMIGVLEGMFTAGDTGGDQTAQITYTVTTTGGESIRKDMFFSDMGPSGSMSAFDLMDDISTLLFNPYRKTEIASLDFDMHIRHMMKRAQLWSARTNRDRYHPGDTVKLALFVQPWREKMQVRRVEFTLPADMEPGAYTLHVLSGNDRARLEATLNPGAFQMRDFEDVVRVLNVYYPANRAFVLLEQGAGGVTLDGKPLQAPPPSVKALLRETAPNFRTASVRGAILKEEAMALDFQLTGRQSIRLTIEKKKSDF
ncbi:MAG: hypothetical protein Kow0059_11690 [Candidatus Sumerlaeia bacterium]